MKKLCIQLELSTPVPTLERRGFSLSDEIDCPPASKIIKNIERFLLGKGPFREGLITTNSLSFHLAMPPPLMRLIRDYLAKGWMKRRGGFSCIEITRRSHLLLLSSALRMEEKVVCLKKS
jgi:hypothetical protein